MKPISVIGMGLSPKDFTSKHLEIISSADILVAGKRHLEFFKDSSAIKKEIDKNLKGLAEFLKNQDDKNVVVIASGDPLFFGIGSFLVRSLGAENVVIYPNISAVAAAFARLKESWHDAYILSLHGRNSEEDLIKAFYEKDKIAIFTDSEKNPSWLAKRLIEKQIIGFQIWVFEQLGSPDEKISFYTPEQAVKQCFSEPNLVILKRIAATAAGFKLDTAYLGMPDESYLHHRGNITKAEVRAVTLSKLKLFSSDHILWDLGSGSGSVAIEAGLFLKNGKMFAVEQKADRVNQIRANSVRFGINNLEVIQAILPDGIENFPKPDRIFIGGGGKELGTIIKAAASHLKPDGIIVVNTVLIQSFVLALESLEQSGFETDFVQIQVSRSQKMSYGQRLEAQNPVWIISGERK